MEPTLMEQVAAKMEQIHTVYSQMKQSYTDRWAEHDTWMTDMERKLNALRGATGDTKMLTDPVNHEKRFQSVLQTYLPGNDLTGLKYGDYKSAFSTFLRKGPNVMTPEQVRAMSVGVDSDGGYYAPPEWGDQVIRVAQLNSVIRQLARVVPVSGPSIEFPASLGLPSVGWVGEGSARPATAGPPAGKLEIFAKEIYAEPLVSQRLLDDAGFDMGNFLADLIGQAFAIAEDIAFIGGDGILQPHGFTTYPTSAASDLSGGRKFGQLQHVPTGVSGGWPASDAGIYDYLTNITMALKPEYRKNAAWVMPTSVITRIMQIKDLQARPIWQPSLAAGQVPTLLGYPVREAENMPVVAANSLSIAFADWQRAYWITDRQGVRVVRDPFTNKPYVLFYTTKRVGGGVVDSLAIKLGKFSVS